jgi:hypothetical protein
VLVLAALASAACDPALRAWRPKPVQIDPSCTTLPPLQPDLPEGAFPHFDDLDGDYAADYIARVPGSCDAQDNCDHAVYVVRESCAVEIGRIRASELKLGYGIMREIAAFERRSDGEEPVLRKTTWRYQVKLHRYTAGEQEVCRWPKHSGGDGGDGDASELTAARVTECRAIEAAPLQPAPPAVPDSAARGSNAP